MTVDRVTGRVVTVEPATTAVSLSELLSERRDVCLRTVERAAVPEWAQSLRPSGGERECIVLTASSADGPWRETASTLRAIAPTVPVVVVSDGPVERLASAAAREGVDAYLNLGAETPQSLVETIEAVVARLDGTTRTDRPDAEQLADRAADPMFEMGRDGQVRWCNTALCSLLDTERDDIAGRHVRAFLPAEDSDRLAALVADSGTGETLETHIDTPDGEAVSYEFSVASAADAAIVVGRDLTEHKRREAHLERRAERLEEFASVVSHDLRNPLNVAIGRLELLEEPQSSDHLETIDGAHRRIEAIIDNLLTMARTGRAAEQNDAVSVAATARAAWDLMETGDATLTVDFDHTVEANPGRLQQLFENLFRNALDHSAGAPAVRVGPIRPIQTATRGTDDTRPTGFYVADDGPGIPVAERAGIFEYGTTGTDGGTGFGLAIVQDIVLEHDWQIHVTTSDSGGACFEISGIAVGPTREESTDTR